MENLIGKRIDREIHGLTVLHLANVRLGNGGADVHFGNVLRDGEQDRRVHGGIHRLAQIHLPSDHNAIHRRGNFAITKIGLRAFQSRLLDGDGCLGLREFSRGLIQIELGGRFQRHERFLSFQILAFEDHVSLGAGQLAFSLPQGGGVHGGIDLGHQHAFGHRRIVIRIQCNDLAGNLAAHIHADNGAQRAAGGNVLHNVTVRHRGRFIFLGAAAGGFAAGANHQHKRGNRGQERAGRFCFHELKSWDHYFQPPPSAW